MSRLVPIQSRYLRVLPFLGLGGLCLLLTACGGGMNPRGMNPGAARDAAMAEVAMAGGDPDKMKAEAYGTIVENPFRAVAVAPLSTFSADVNTASYSNIRRFITQGEHPPRDAVFLADMVNYFPYRYPEPTNNAPVSLTLDLAACPWQPEHKLARIGVKAYTLGAHEQPRRNLVFLIDTSGSMDGETRLPLVKQSLEMLVERLTPADRVSIVTYSGDAGLKLPPTSGDQKGRILEVVRSLGSGGGTHGSAGIKLAYETARRSYIEGGANRVILCTDGDFNVGLSSESDLVQLIEKERASRVFLTILGFGMGNLKYGNLEKLASHGNGHFAYIDNIDEARKVFVEQGGALVCVAKDVKFQVKFNPSKVSAYRLIGYENRILKDEDFKNDAKDAGDLGSGHTVTALYEIVPVGVKLELPGVDPLKYQAPPQPKDGSTEWLTVKMRYKEPEGDASKELVEPLPAGEKAMSEDFRFAAAVAEFGLVLRDSPYKGKATLADVLSRATTATDYDPNGHRKEFVDLVKQTAAIKGKE